MNIYQDIENHCKDLITLLNITNKNDDLIIKTFEGLQDKMVELINNQNI